MVVMGRFGWVGWLKGVIIGGMVNGLEGMKKVVVGEKVNNLGLGGKGKLLRLSGRSRLLMGWKGFR
ncbi:hypothetical protein, partial [Paenibacillus xylanexedens]|uniref:hypothetical protein n=1 Tax=Paenibacillus xylanexedens TaxID=528191 RepID=UPI001C93159F